MPKDFFFSSFLRSRFLAFDFFSGSGGKRKRFVFPTAMHRLLVSWSIAFFFSQNVDLVANPNECHEGSRLEDTEMDVRGGGGVLLHLSGREEAAVNGTCPWRDGHVAYGSTALKSAWPVEQGAGKSSFERHGLVIFISSN